MRAGFPNWAISNRSRREPAHTACINRFIIYIIFGLISTLFSNILNIDEYSSIMRIAALVQQNFHKSLIEAKI